MKLSSVIKEDDDNNIEYLISKYVELANSGGSDKALQKWLSMITVRLASLGSGQGAMKKIVASIKGASDQKDVDKIIAQYGLYNDYPDTFVAEMSLFGALSEDVEEDVRKYKVVLSIPFTTEKNRKDKDDCRCYYKSSDGARRHNDPNCANKNDCANNKIERRLIQRFT